jgi:hypothetical protein
MTKDQIIEAAALYLAHLVSLGAEPVRMANLSAHYMPPPNQGMDMKLRNHLAWMCDLLIKTANAGEIEKAGRWLGFVQGVLFVLGDYSIDEYRTHDGVREVP